MHMNPYMGGCPGMMDPFMGYPGMYMQDPYMNYPGWEEPFMGNPGWHDPYMGCPGMGMGEMDMYFLLQEIYRMVREMYEQQQMQSE
ncbi:MAG: hypothetical protein GXY91_00520 [Clostridia bacterium]|nr:hypothetical protein [Clostridia bacterium]